MYIGKFEDNLIPVTFLYENCNMSTIEGITEIRQTRLKSYRQVNITYLHEYKICFPYFE